MLQLDITVERASGLKHTGKHCVELLLDGHEPVRSPWVEDEIDRDGHVKKEKRWGQAGRGLVINLRGSVEDYASRWLHIGVIHHRTIRQDKRAAEGSVPFNQLVNGLSGWVVLEHKSQFGGKVYLVCRLLSRQLVHTPAAPRTSAATSLHATSTAPRSNVQTRSEASAPPEFQMTEAELEEQRAIMASIKAANAGKEAASAPTVAAARQREAVSASQGDRKQATQAATSTGQWSLEAPPAPAPGRATRRQSNHGSRENGGAQSPMGFNTAPAPANACGGWGSSADAQWGDWPHEGGARVAAAFGGDAGHTDAFGQHPGDAFADDAFRGGTYEKPGLRDGAFGAMGFSEDTRPHSNAPSMDSSSSSPSPSHGRRDGVASEQTQGRRDEALPLNGTFDRSSSSSPGGRPAQSPSSDSSGGEPPDAGVRSSANVVQPDSMSLPSAAMVANTQSSPHPSSNLPQWIEWRRFLSDFGDAAVESAPAANGSGVAVTGPISIPTEGAIVAPTGRRKALVIGIGYLTTPGQLNGPHSDLEQIRSMLLRVGFSQEHILCLRDGQADFSLLPTKRNVLSALRWLAHGAVAGDTLFFYYSGHGSQVLDAKAPSANAVDDTICPVDLQWAGHISDHQLFECIVRHLPAGVRLTALLDCCVPGLSLNLPWVCDEQRGWVAEPDAYQTLGDVVCFSLRAAEDVSADLLRALCARPSGVMTSTFLEALGQLAQRQGGPVTYLQLVASMRELLRVTDLDWQIRFTASQAFDPSQRPFRFSDAVSNGNPTIGLQVPRAPKIPRAWCGPHGVDQALRFPPEIGPPPPYHGEASSPLAQAPPEAPVL
eukprot:TRINITY_DN21718_c0_g3_i1.p1 TRINITY_DN21718_c0_g3~~TRINITY_DN21718_c0_g3_i1.p1  ORF type:complete len:828 (+),score=88.06 TRINITY_DN21718_c0_g3_i1:109-2592(+)